MADVATAVAAAGQAIAVRIDRPFIPGATDAVEVEPEVGQRPAIIIETLQGTAAARVAGRADAVEPAAAPGYPPGYAGHVADAEQAPPPRPRQPSYGRGDHA